MRSALIITFTTNKSREAAARALGRTALPSVLVDESLTPELGARVYLAMAQPAALTALVRQLTGAGFHPRAIIDGSTQDTARLVQITGTLMNLPWAAEAVPSLHHLAAPAAAEAPAPKEASQPPPEVPAVPPSAPDLTPPEAAPPTGEPVPPQQASSSEEAPSTPALAAAPPPLESPPAVGVSEVPSSEETEEARKRRLAQVTPG